MDRMNAKQLRKSSPGVNDIKSLNKNPIYFVLDNIYDTYNIGSLFRLADATGIAKIYLCGKMEYPPSSRIHKAAVGTENWVAWEKRDETKEVVEELKQNGVLTVAVEQDAKSVSYLNLTDHLKFPVAVIVGHETEGISKRVLEISDLIVELPMFGINKSFNVWGSCAVVTYKILEKLK